MGNNWFKFKQFTIKQNRCAHKLGTDSILLGSWVNIDGVKTIFDIGVGCGVLSLMMAQRNTKVKIFGVEIDRDSYEQALENIRHSPWFDRISVQNTPLQELDKIEQKYDLIITNPPYYVNSLKSPDLKRSNARHAHTLTTDEIIQFSNSHLEPDGKLALILPINLFENFKNILEQNSFHIQRLAKVFPNYEKPAHRIIVECGRLSTDFEYEEITIETNQRHVYTRKYAELTKDFYFDIKN